MGRSNRSGVHTRVHTGQERITNKPLYNLWILSLFFLIWCLCSSKAKVRYIPFFKPNFIWSKPSLVPQKDRDHTNIHGFIIKKRHPTDFHYTTWNLGRQTGVEWEKRALIIRWRLKRYCIHPSDESWAKRRDIQESTSLPKFQRRETIYSTFFYQGSNW